MTMKRLLVIRWGALGDLIHLSPSIQAAKNADPTLEIHCLTSPLHLPLVQNLKGVDQVWAWEKRQGWKRLFQLAAQLRDTKIDTVINLHPSFKSWLLTCLIQPERQATYHKEKLQTKGRAQRSLARRHAVADFYEPFRRLLGLTPLTFAKVPPQLLLKQCKETKPNNERQIAIIPWVGGKRANRAWGSAAYLELIEKLLAHKNFRVLLVGGPSEKALAESMMHQIAQHCERLENHCGSHTILETAQLLSGCDLVIGGDTGPLHLATSVGTPVLGLYGPTSLDRTGPVGNQATARLTPPDDLACWPCELPRCPYSGDEHLACMKQISVGQVLQEAMMMLAPVDNYVDNHTE